MTIPFKTKFAHIHTNGKDSELSESVQKMNLNVAMKINVQLWSNQGNNMLCKDQGKTPLKKLQYFSYKGKM